MVPIYVQIIQQIKAQIAECTLKENEALHRQLQASIAELRTLIDRYGPPPGAEAPTEKVFKDYPSMVAEDLSNKDNN